MGYGKLARDSRQNCDHAVRFAGGRLSATFDLETGREAWRTGRAANPSWSTPGVFDHGTETEIVVNAAPLIQSYDVKTGKELWRLGPSTTNTTPTPVFGEGLIFVANGYNPIKPIYAVRPGARGDLTLKEGETSSEAVAWSDMRNGPYMATPLVYRGILYVVWLNGVLTALEAKTGKQLYQQRIAPGGYSSSPVASDGRIYVADEEGNLYVLKAGPEFEILGRTSFKEVVMATPAIAGGMMLIRTQHHLQALAAPAQPGAHMREGRAEWELHSGGASAKFDQHGRRSKPACEKQKLAFRISGH